jgi:hypothetical protein
MRANSTDLPAIRGTSSAPGVSRARGRSPALPDVEGAGRTEQAYAARCLRAADEGAG